MYKYLTYKSNLLRNLAQVRTFLILVAMETEERALLGASRAHKIITKGHPGLRSILHERKAAGRRLIVGRCGVGLTSAGIHLAQVVAAHKIDAVILMGVAGALDPRLNPGDVVVSESVIQHDSTISGDRSTHLIAPGELVLSRPKDKQIDPVMRCDSLLAQWAFASLKKARPHGVFRGALLSGGEFVGSTKRKRLLHKLAANALAVDMEAAAIAQICRRLKIPFVAVKTIADRANPSRSISDDYGRFLLAAAENGRAILNGLIDGLEVK